MSFSSLLSVEFKKIKRSKILLILLAAAVFLWLPSILNADINFTETVGGISPENNFFIQGFLGMACFMFPASMVVGTVLINQTERSNKGILKMLSLPVSTVKLCLAKYVVLLSLAAVEVIMSTVMYFISSAIVSGMQSYNMMLSPLYVFKEAGLVYLAAIPMIAFFWALSILIQTPIFSIGTGLASIVPSLLIMNTKIWYVYPMCYPFYIITSEYGRLAEDMSTWNVDLFPLLPIAVIFTLLCLTVSCAAFGRAERK